MSKPVVAVAALLFVAALALPTEPLTRALAGPGIPLGKLATGVLILNGALALLALLLLLASRWAPSGAPCEPLVSSGVRPAGRLNAATIWALGGVSLLGLSLRWNALGVGLSFDEIDTLVNYARRPLHEVIALFDSQNQHLAYSVLARLSFVAFGESAVALRLPAALLGVASLLAVYGFARRVADWRESIFATVLLTVAYHHIWFSQNARGYTGLLLFTLLGSSQFLRMLGETRPEGLRAPLWYGLWMALATLTHATAVLIVGAHALVWLGLLWARRGHALGANRWQPALGGLFAASFSLVGYALVLPQFLDTLLAPTLPGVQSVWKSPWWLVSETFQGVARGVPGGAFTLALALGVFALGVRSYARQSMAVVAVFFAPALVMLVALLATKHNLWPRMFFFGAGFYVLVALRGIVEWTRIFSFGQLPGLLDRLTLAALSLACLVNAASMPMAWLPKQNFEGPREFLAQALRPGDAVVTVGMTTLPYAAYFTEPWTSVDIPDAARPDSQRSLDALLAIETAHPRTWIVFTTPPQLLARQPLVWQRIESEYTAQRETFWGTLGGGEVVVVRRDRPEASANSR